MTVTCVPKPKGLKPEVWAVIVEAYSLGGHRTLGDMSVAMHRAAKAGDMLSADIPPEYSLRRYVERLQEFYRSEPAGLKDFPIEHSAYLLEVLGTVLCETEGRIANFSRAEVDWIVRVHTAAPMMPPYEVYRFACEYWNREQAGVSARTLDFSLARYGGWGWNGFSEAFENNWLPDGAYPGFSSGRIASKALAAARERNQTVREL